MIGDEEITSRAKNQVSGSASLLPPSIQLKFYFSILSKDKTEEWGAIVVPWESREKNEEFYIKNEGSQQKACRKGDSQQPCRKRPCINLMAKDWPQSSLVATLPWAASW